MKKTIIWLVLLAMAVSLAACGSGERPDGIYDIQAQLIGGSGKAHIEKAQVELKDGAVTATITWSSPYYDFMIIDDVRYEPVNEEGNSVFVIPAVLDQDMAVSADTVAMSQPHLIDYKLHFDSSTMKEP